jgi:hypothetical protein
MGTAPNLTDASWPRWKGGRYQLGGRNTTETKDQSQSNSLILKEHAMFEINCAISYHKPDGSESKAAESRLWADLNKGDVHDFEAAFNRALTKLNKLSGDRSRGRNKMKLGSTNPCEMRMDITITEDDAKWLRVSYEWPNCSEEGQAFILGAIDGELSTLSDEVRGTERRSGKRK